MLGYIIVADEFYIVISNRNVRKSNCGMDFY